MHKYEELVALLNSTTDPFQLAHHLDVIKGGMNDLLARLQFLELKLGIKQK